MSFPTTPILDDFDRDDDEMRSSWEAGGAEVFVTHPTSSDPDRLAYWQAPPFDPSKGVEMSGEVMVDKVLAPGTFIGVRLVDGEKTYWTKTKPGRFARWVLRREPLWIRVDENSDIGRAINRILVVREPGGNA